MVFFLILGALLGSLSVIFVLQNITPITVTLFAWHIDGSLSIILFLALMSGMLMTILLLVPGFIRDEFRFMSLKKQNKALEDELAITKKQLTDIAFADVNMKTPSNLHDESVL